MAKIASNLTEDQAVTQIAEILRAIKKPETKVIALVGGPASGKGTLAALLQENLHSAAIISTDDYVRGDRRFRREEIEHKGGDPILKYNFDFLKEQVKQIAALREDQTIGVPQYDEITGIAIGPDPVSPPDTNTYSKKIGRVDYLMIEGDFQPLSREKLDYLIYLDVSDEVRLANRIHRDLQERGEHEEQKIRDNFELRQRTQFIPHTLPNKEQADMVIEVKAAPLDTPTLQRKFNYRFSLHTN